ncbi:hypothetical protein RI367_001422 [Sorochytrium milnesiophthora]
MKFQLVLTIAIAFFSAVSAAPIAAAGGGLAGLLDPANLGLNLARLETATAVNKGVRDAKKLQAAAAVNNAQLSQLAANAEAGFTQAAGGIANIKNDLLAGNAPKDADRATTAAGIQAAKAATDQMDAAVAAAGAPDAAVQRAVTKLQNDVAKAVDGGEKVLQLG